MLSAMLQRKRTPRQQVLGTNKFDCQQYLPISKQGEAQIAGSHTPINVRLCDYALSCSLSSTALGKYRGKPGMWMQHGKGAAYGCNVGRKLLTMLVLKMPGAVYVQLLERCAQQL